MSKGEGRKIAIKFTDDLIGDVSGMNPKPIAPGNYFKPTGIATASSQYSSYSPTRAFDNNESSYWYTRESGTQWIQIQLEEPLFSSGFRWYIGGRYRPNGFEFQGSNDGISWDNLLTSSSENTTGWQEFDAPIAGPYIYYRWNITSKHSSYIYIYEVELKGASGQEGAFFITGKEYKYLHGPLINVEYKVDRVEKHPVEANSVLLTMKDFNSFNNIEGHLTIHYNAIKGNLSGRGGVVESFTERFTPTDLVPEPTPAVAETISVAPTGLDIELVPIEYIDGFSKGSDSITVAPTSLEIELVHIDIENP